MRFPQSEADVAVLALALAQGLAQAAEDFPSPPYTAEEMQALLDAYNATLAAIMISESEFHGHHADKDDALDKLVGGMKATFKYAEVAAREHPENLNKIGWGPRRGSASLRAPGEVRDITVRAQGDSWVVLDWNEPVNGGDPAAYKVQRRERDGGSWEDIATAVGTEHMVARQPRGVELDYHVIAVNRAGAGQPSGTVTLVL